MYHLEVVPLVDAALRGASVALLLMLCFRLWRLRLGLWVVRIGFVLTLGLCVQVISGMPVFEAKVPFAWQMPLIGISVANSVLFWLFVRAICDDEFVLRPVHGAVWLAVALFSLTHCILIFTQSAAGVRVFMAAVIRWIPLIFAILAMYAAVLHWSADLVERRRRLRLFVVVTGVLYTAGIAVIRVLSGRGQLSEPYAVLDVAALLIVVGGVAAHVLTLRSTDLLILPTSAPEPLAQPSSDVTLTNQADGGADPEQDKLLTRLAQMMTQEHAYRLENLTVASLAAKLGVAEYRLRRAINGHLGYRNFNAYINSFRLEQARIALMDPAQRHLPVLTIALESGFQSIGPFNRAFKAQHGLTPTEFRQQHIADS